MWYNVPHSRSRVQVPPMLVYVCTNMCIKKLSCQAGHQEIWCHTRGESEEFIAHRQGIMQVRDPPWLWTLGRLHQKSKLGITVTPQKALMFFNLKKQNNVYQLLSPQVGVNCLHSWSSEHNKRHQILDEVVSSIRHNEDLCCIVRNRSSFGWGTTWWPTWNSKCFFGNI